MRNGFKIYCPMNKLLSPNFIYDERQLEHSNARVLALVSESGCKVLYSPKACTVPGVLKNLANHMDGFSCSSLFEVHLVQEVVKHSGAIHLTTPGILAYQIDEIIEACDTDVLNSLSQWLRFREELKGTVDLGLRINPQLSFAEDPRYDPCREYSKLGVPLDQLADQFSNSPQTFVGLNGLHFHNNCDSTDPAALAATVDKIIAAIPSLLNQVSWINLGGGYLLDEFEEPDIFTGTVQRLTTEYDLDVIIEPGAALVRTAGSIVSSVIDLFESDGITVAVLDTTVNHMPEVLEYEFVPDVLGHVDGGKYSYLLAGCTCLAGDQFGISSFDAPIEIGSTITFPNTGAYTISRANTFNGVNLPSIYRRDMSGNLILEKEHTFEEFAARAGVVSNVRV